MDTATQKTDQLHVTGMHCASCSNIISKKIKKLPGVTQVDVNVVTEKAAVSYDPSKISIKQMNDVIKPLGYSIKQTEQTLMPASHGSMSENEHATHLGLTNTKDEKLQELQQTKRKLQFVLPTALFFFLLMMWEIATHIFPRLPHFPVSMASLGTVSFIIASIVLFWIGKPFIEAVGRGIKYRVANMDTLIGIGTITAYTYSTVVLLFPAVKALLHAPDVLYFDVTIVVIGFITLGKYLEARSKLKTGEAIEKLLTLQAKTALVLRKGKEIEVPIDQVLVGEVVIVKPGAKVPVDGIIVEGSSAIDESMVTGESMPQDKKPGDVVVGATINKQGNLQVRATKVGADTILAQIVSLVESAQGSKAPIQNLADSVSAIFVPVVLVIALVTLLVWLSIGSIFLGFSQALSFGLLAFVGILVIACPCALGLATPTAIIVGVGKGAEHGILIKNAESLEKLHAVDTVVFDKTGTLTSGKPTVTDSISLDASISGKQLLQIAASIEHKSQHPLASAVVEKAHQLSLPLSAVTEFKETEGVGVAGTIKGSTYLIQKPGASISESAKISSLEADGKTVVVVYSGKKMIGILGISDVVKPEAKAVIRRLHDLKIKTVLLTGDNQRAADYIGKMIEVDSVIARVMPQDKARIITDLQKKGGVVAMAGDGINDAPALSQANVGIAMASGTDIAIESADITLLGGDIAKIPQAIQLSRATIRTIKQNLFWAFIYNLIGIPLAAGVFYPLFGIFLNPIFAGMAMAFSSVSVVTNSLLLKRMQL